MRRLWIVGLILIGVAFIGSAVSPAVSRGVPTPWSGTSWMHGGGLVGSWNQMGEHHAWMHGHLGGSAEIPGASEVAVVAVEFRFDPPTITVEGPVNLTLINQGSLLHDLTIPALGIRVVTGPGERSTIGFPSSPVGEYEIFCSIPGHAEAGMVGTIEVTG
ncbi:MAG TPA: cupredoxin domain-containing protein [Acidimicrobiia bacterium]|nr:cupredoxin domain-containing protein [Acidimicrobiia bacterium]